MCVYPIIISRFYAGVHHQKELRDLQQRSHQSQQSQRVEFEQRGAASLKEAGELKLRLAEVGGVYTQDFIQIEEGGVVV